MVHQRRRWASKQEAGWGEWLPTRQAEEELARLCGRWQDQRGSEYALTLEGNDSIAVCTTRVTGEVIETEGLVRIEWDTEGSDTGRVVWGKKGARFLYTVGSHEDWFLLWQCSVAKPFSWERIAFDIPKYQPHRARKRRAKFVEKKPAPPSPPPLEASPFPSRSCSEDFGSHRAKLRKEFQQRRRDQRADPVSAAPRGRSEDDEKANDSSASDERTEHASGGESTRGCSDATTGDACVGNVSKSLSSNSSKSSLAAAPQRPPQLQQPQQPQQPQPPPPPPPQLQEPPAAPTQLPAPTRCSGERLLAALCGGGVPPGALQPPEDMRYMEDLESQVQAFLAQPVYQAYPPVTGLVTGAEEVWAPPAMAFQEAFLDAPGWGHQAPLSALGQVCSQLEYYFSNANLRGDTYLRNLMMPFEGWVNIMLLQNFPRMRALGADAWSIRQAVLRSAAVELDGTGCYVRIREKLRRDRWVTKHA